ncbi:hypothetical protein ABT369_39020 [Dactylosporangium sp. NPDC000244]|uniref:hypothetical protein n=1 Tax=Dactylosporangium sp. NPDC000244 TaxID=3154365 RepID=UPI003332ED9C
MTPQELAVAEFCVPRGTLADRLGHQSVWKSGDPADYTHHVTYCAVCRDLDAGGDGLGNPR